MSNFIKVNNHERNYVGRVDAIRPVIINVDLVDFIQPSPSPEEKGLYFVRINGYGMMLLSSQDAQKIFNIIGVSI
ncbi:MAG: hypothetical protein E7260_09670 [Lachnospiraceae bacterium]|nr:hypothetical protein [Lachnospiraceae bacterium]